MSWASHAWILTSALGPTTKKHCDSTATEHPRLSEPVIGLLLRRLSSKRAVAAEAEGLAAADAARGAATVEVAAAVMVAAVPALAVACVREGSDVSGTS